MNMESFLDNVMVYGFWIGLGFGVLVAAELIAAERGMGHLVMEARQLGQLGVSIFGIFLIGIVNLIADRQLARLIGRTIGRWHAL